MENKAKAKMVKLSVQDKKLSRLLNCKNFTPEDEVLVDFYYEQRYYDLFVYANVCAAILGIIPSFTFLMHRNTTQRWIYAGGLFFFFHLVAKKNIYNRFWANINPFFEKYEIK